MSRAIPIRADFEGWSFDDELLGEILLERCHLRDFLGEPRLHFGQQLGGSGLITLQLFIVVALRQVL
jgi:hypothetical protein